MTTDIELVDKRRLTILGVRVDCVDFAQLLDQITVWIATARHQAPASTTVAYPVYTVNPEIVMAARRDPHFAAVLARGALCVPDGVGLLWAARRQGVILHERVTGSDGIYLICARAAQEGWRVFLLGAAPGVAATAAQRLQARYPRLQVVGTASGSPAAADWPAIHHQLQVARPDILFVAFGHPRQEIWIDRYQAALSVPVALGVGGAFDFVAGVTTRAPRWLQQLGLEWLHRLFMQPWRWRRMAVLPWFVWLVWWRGRTGVSN